MFQIEICFYKKTSFTQNTKSSQSLFYLLLGKKKTIKNFRKHSGISEYSRQNYYFKLKVLRLLQNSFLFSFRIRKIKNNTQYRNYWNSESSLKDCINYFPLKITYESKLQYRLSSFNFWKTKLLYVVSWVIYSPFQ